MTEMLYKPEPAIDEHVDLYEVDKARVACSGEDPELFFPIGETTPTARQTISEAKAICMGCVVVEKCREYALQRPEDYGIWGGMTESERKAERRRRKSA